MTAYLLIPPDEYRIFICDDKGLEYRLKRLALRGVTKEQCEIKTGDKIRFDFGGCARINEEEIDIEHNGTIYSATLTQFPWALSCLQGRKPNDDGFIQFVGFPARGYCMTVEDRDAILWKMEQLWPEVELKCKKAEEDMAAALSRAGVLNMRKPPPDNLVP